MSTHRAGIAVVGGTVTVVLADVPSDPAVPITIISDINWALQTGDRAPALALVHQRCADFFKQHPVDSVVIKASAVPQGSVKLAVLESAEVRGVIIAAAASASLKVRCLQRAVISRTYGTRKVEEYIKDDAFWTEHVTGEKLKKSSREAAMLILATR